ncbi:MAG TPA: tRNA pseudouridine(38-40) synthase TruA [Pseudomonadales bacterium]|nr:tRNA pseudouridine(38-40) synthase TruA [Pseudomonadales bacterium]
MQRWALGVEYDGTRFGGFQRQRHGKLPTVQGDLEAALSRIADHPVTLICAGRTDAGVHATGQVVHFETGAQRAERSWLRGLNTLTDPGLCIHWARPVAADFHARFSARWRRYLYVLTDQPVRPALLRDRVAQASTALDAEAMGAAAQYLLGEHDFASFRASGCQARHGVREVQAVSVTRRGPLIGVDIRANAFLQHMVRNIVGSLMVVGRGEATPEWIGELLAARDRTRAGAAARPEGLYLVEVGYPAEAEIPAVGPTLTMPFALID